MSARVDTPRTKGWQFSYLAAMMNDIPVSCTKCGGKYSVPAAPIIEDLESQGSYARPLPTR